MLDLFKSTCNRKVRIAYEDSDTFVCILAGCCSSSWPFGRLPVYIVIKGGEAFLIVSGLGPLLTEIETVITALVVTPTDIQG